MMARSPFSDAYLGRSSLVRVGRHAVASPREYHFVLAKGESRPEVLALVERMKRAADGLRGRASGPRGAGPT